MDRQQNITDPINDNETVSARRFTRDRFPTPLSILFGRTSAVLLAAPWLFVLMDTALRSDLARSWPLRSLLPWIALALLTLVGVAFASHFLRRIRRYEAKCDSERLLFANARDPMLLIHVLRTPNDKSSPLKFVVKAKNPAATSQLNRFGQEWTLVNHSITDFLPSWLTEKVIREYTACVTTRQIRRYEICSPDGSLAHESMATPVFDATGTHVTHIVVIRRDISERIQNERIIADALRRAEEANKSKSQFLASMSHELRTPLNAVLGYSEMLGLGIGGALSERQREYAQFIHQSGNHLLNIIGDILDLSKIEAGQFVLHEEETIVSPLVASCVLMIKERLFGKGLKLAIKIPPNLPLFRADPLRLKQVVLNLLSNAIKFTDVGTITITATFDAVEGLRLAVADTGIGMTKEEISVALEPFGQVQSAYNRNHEGTGLGLSIARHLMELHGGQLSVASSKGSGTTVSITIPPERLMIEPAALLA